MRRSRPVLPCLAALLLLAGGAWAQETENPYTPAARTKDYPWMSSAVWRERHEKLLKLEGKDKAQVVFLGDSITDGWDRGVWEKYYAPLGAANLGIGGDTTQNVLWRITNGELEGLRPKVFVVLIGTNNFGLGNFAPDAVAKGIFTILEALKAKCPEGKVLLLGIFPRDEKPKTGFRNKIAATNALIAKLDDGKRIRYLDLTAKLLNADGTMSKEIMADFLHPTAKGYQVWAEAMQPLLLEMLGQKAQAAGVGAGR